MIEISRRQMLGLMGASGAVALGCSDDPAPAPADAAVVDANEAGASDVTDAGVTDLGAPEDTGVDAGRDVFTGDADGRSGVFLHGVASGDPLTTAVILWTRVTLAPGATAPVEVTWELSTTVDFTSLTGTGTFTTNADRDWTVKVDATGLAAATTYYYRFRAMGMTSPIGRTRTAPEGMAARARFAVVSCSSMAHGFFHVYRNVASRLDLDAVLHLGDYIYEYGNGEYGEVRVYDPPHEIVTLGDYRRRYAHYRRDADLRAAHQQHPFVCIWDDHEFANNAYADGAENHMPMTEGEWRARKAAAMRAYAEWMPLRDQMDGRIFRRLPYGDLADLVMLDTRIWARPEQAGSGPDASAIINDPMRTLLGNDQERWLQEQLTTTRARWKVVGQQVMMGQLPLIVNDDQWDGHTAARQRFFDLLRAMMVNDVVVLTGDIHTTWAIDLAEAPTDATRYDPTTGRGALAVEFVVPGISSPGFPPNLANLASAVQRMAPHMKFVDLTKRGYGVLDLTPARCQMAFFHLADVTDPTDRSESFAGAFSTVPGRNHLERDSMAAAAPASPHAAAPAEPA